MLSGAEYLPRFSIVALRYTHTVFKSPSGQPKLSAKFHKHSGCPRFVLTERLWPKINPRLLAPNSGLLARALVPASQTRKDGSYASFLRVLATRVAPCPTACAVRSS